MEEAVKKKYLKCKYKVKKWEGEFKDIHNTNPSKADIKNAPKDIKEAYKTYWKLKTLCLETTLVDVSFDNEDTMDSFCCTAEQDITNNITVECNADGDTLENISFQSNAGGENAVEINNLSLVEKSKSNITEDSEQTEQNDTIPLDKVLKDKNESSVWGPHLSLSKKKVEDKPKQKKSSVLSRFTEKLFAGASFKKRNPRKSFIRREKSESSVQISSLENSLSSLVTDLGNSLSQPEAHNYDSNGLSKFDENSLQGEQSQSLNTNCSSIKVVKNVNLQKPSQPVSFLQKSLADENGLIKQSVCRKVDKGWLERLENRTTVETLKRASCSDSGIESSLTDSSVVSFEPKSSPPNTDPNNSDDEDVVCDSDSESERTKFRSSFSLVTKSVKIQPSSTDVSSHSLKRTSSSFTSHSSLRHEPNNSLSFTSITKSDKRSIDFETNDVMCSDIKKFKLDYLPDTTSSSTILSGTKRISLQTGITDEESKMQPSYLHDKQSNALKSKEKVQEDILRKKLACGKANENFVKINIKKKTYVRGKKTMTFQKYKKQKWKDMKKKQNYCEKGVYKCFKCGDVGHFSKNCLKACDQLLPIEDLGEEDSPFPTLQEAEEMAKETSKKLCVQRNLHDLPVHVAKEHFDINDLTIPPPLISDDLMRFVQQEPVFKTNDDGSLIDTPLIVLETLVKFGFESWRPGQETAVMRILSGLSTLVTLSTGSGKSLCYQLPAYIYHMLQQRITIVISPLVSLMEDQVSNVPDCLKIACLNTSQSPKEREAVYQQLRENTLHALLLSPEAVATGDRVNELLRSLPPVAFACIDEAHCISQWSHNFRPSYLMICQVLREKFGVKTILGLTATATIATIASVSEALGLPDGVENVIRDTPLPDNLRLSVSRDKQKDLSLIDLLKGPRFSHCSSIIIYCTRREECQRLAAYLRTCLQDVTKEDGIKKRGKVSWNAEAYHAGLTTARRKSVQKAFMSGKTRIVVATVAFGMGINKQDIEGIIHYNMPCAFERYVQEVGRAGRNGQESNCHLFLNTEGKDLGELQRHIYADFVERHTIRKLLQRVFVPCKCGEACPSHEVAFSVSDTVAALDLPEENISTLLCYLELHARQWVHVCSPVYTRCRILSYKGPKLIRQAAKECPPLAVAVAMELEKGVALDKVTKLEFSIFPVAAAIKWDSGIVKHQLKSIEWTKVKDQPRPSGLKVEFYDLGFRVQAPGNLSGEELDSALDSLTTRVEAQEKTALKQLQAIFQLLMQVSHSSVDECLDKVDQDRCERLKTDIRQYFTKENYLDSYDLPEVILNNEEQIVADIRNLVNCYRDVNFSGRAVARIFHGIPSPNYPAQQWGRCRFWRAHLHEDFKVVCKLATRELIKMR